MKLLEEIIALGQSAPNPAEMDLELIQKILALNSEVRISDIKRVGASAKKLHRYYVEAAQLLHQYLSLTGQEKLAIDATPLDTAVKHELARLERELKS